MESSPASPLLNLNQAKASVVNKAGLWFVVSQGPKWSPLVPSECHSVLFVKLDVAFAQRKRHVAM